MANALFSFPPFPFLLPPAQIAQVREEIKSTLTSWRFVSPFPPFSPSRSRFAWRIKLAVMRRLNRDESSDSFFLLPLPFFFSSSLLFSSRRACGQRRCRVPLLPDPAFRVQDSRLGDDPALFFFFPSPPRSDQRQERQPQRKYSA